MQSADVLIIGAGMAGASCAYFLQSRANVIILERESQPGYHTTGRSAAMFIETYGNDTVRRLSKASAEFFRNPLVGFSDLPLVRLRGALVIARADQRERLERIFQDGRAITSRIFRLGRSNPIPACERWPAPWPLKWTAC
jgi:D-arginine dehydrogenase